MVNNIVAVLTYTLAPKRGIVGQQVGADGAGDYCVIYRGDEDKARQAITTLLEDCSRSHRITKHTIVWQGQDYFSQPLIRLSNV